MEQQKQNPVEVMSRMVTDVVRMTNAIQTSAFGISDIFGKLVETVNNQRKEIEALKAEVEKMKPKE